MSCCKHSKFPLPPSFPSIFSFLFFSFFTPENPSFMIQSFGLSPTLPEISEVHNSSQYICYLLVFTKSLLDIQTIHNMAAYPTLMTRVFCVKENIAKSMCFIIRKWIITWTWISKEGREWARESKPLKPNVTPPCFCLAITKEGKDHISFICI